MREVIDRGYLYIAQPPLYKAERGKSERYLKDDAEMDAFLISEGVRGQTLILSSGEQVAGEDLRSRVRDAAAFDSLLSRVALRAPRDVVEQAAIAGMLRSGAGEQEAALTAVRLNRIAEEGEDGWSGSFDGQVATFRRTVRGVEDRAVLDRSVLALPEARRLSERAEAYGAFFEGAGSLRHEKGGETSVFGPSSLLRAVLEAGARGVKIQRYKGLGEMNPGQLWETTLDANARTLLQVRIDQVSDADEMFSKLMGDVVEPRREFIQDNALEAEVDA
jgi:DNA gyrase subunit B